MQGVDKRILHFRHEDTKGENFHKGGSQPLLGDFVPILFQRFSKRPLKSLLSDWSIHETGADETGGFDQWVIRGDEFQLSCHLFEEA